MRGGCAPVLFGALLASGCLHRFGPPTPTPTLPDIKNATYAGVLQQPVELRNGAAPGVLLLDALVAFGDLDGRPGDEAAVLISESGKAGGELVYLAAVGVREGRTVNLGTTLIGDRTKVRDLRIADGAVSADVVEAGPNDATCCPTQLARKTYTLRRDALQMDSSLPTGALSIQTLGVELWTLMSMDGQPTPEGCSAPTVQFNGIRLASFGGCNAHMGTIQETAPGEIKVSTLAGGKKACPPAHMNLDQEFVSRLEKVDRYTFLAGRLALSGEARGEPFLLLFERAETKAAESPL